MSDIESKAKATPGPAAASQTTSVTHKELGIKVVSTAPPHPEAKGVPVPPVSTKVKQPYEFGTTRKQEVTMPVVVSGPPSAKRLQSYNSSDTSSEEYTDQSGGLPVRFELSVNEASEQDQVRITGNIAALGEWDISKSISLKRSDSESKWTIELEVPSDRPVKYRYFITRPVGGDSRFKIVSQETSPQPRLCTAKRSPTTTNQGPCTQHDQYGISPDGTLAVDEGWLLNTSELQLQLGTQGPAISLTNKTQNEYLVKVEPFSTAPPSQEVECSEVKARLCHRSTGECVRLPGNDPCPYNQANNVIVFITQATTFSTMGYNIDIYESSLKRLGRASLLPQQISADSCGLVTLTVFSEQLLPIGTLTLSYLLIEPVRDVELVHTVKHSYGNYWRKHKRMLHIGHRGLGDSYHSEMKPTVTENTISSLKLAGTHGADYVEFDVQLTKDHVPIVYHNFTVCTTLAREGFFSGELYALQVKHLTLEQLQSLKLDHSSALKKKTLDAPNTGGTGSSSDQDSASDSQWGGGATYKEVLPERKTFPTLKKLFRSLPKHIEFDLEVKYPLPERGDQGTVVKDYDKFEINFIADTILRVVYKHARGRRVLFTCFNPDMCTVLRRKQHKYPVLLLTCASNPDYGVPLDVRGHTVYDAMMHSKASNLLGIVPNSTPLLGNPRLVRAVKDAGLVLLTWGHENNDIGNIGFQDKAGVDAVIYDCIHTLLPGPQKNIFQLEKEEREREKTKKS